jgi:hypothetical protein
MATVHKITYSTTNTAISITLAALANLAARSSAYVDNSSNVYLDASIRAKVGIGVLSGTDNAVYLYGYGSEDAVAFSGFTSGTDAAVLTTSANFPLMGVITTNVFNPVTSTDYTFYIGSVANAFGGNLPKYWGVVVDNRSGGALVNTAANHVITYTGIYATST